MPDLSGLPEIDDTDPDLSGLPLVDDGPSPYERTPGPANHGWSLGSADPFAGAVASQGLPLDVAAGAWEARTATQSDPFAGAFAFQDEIQVQSDPFAGAVASQGLPLDVAAGAWEARTIDAAGAAGAFEGATATQGNGWQLGSAFPAAPANPFAGAVASQGPAAAAPNPFAGAVASQAPAGPPPPRIPWTVDPTLSAALNQGAETIGRVLGVGPMPASQPDPLASSWSSRRRLLVGATIGLGLLGLGYLLTRSARPDSSSRSDDER